MIICDNCFASERIRQGIQREGVVGNCPTCGSKGHKILDTDLIPQLLPELIEWFDDLLSHFTYERAIFSAIPESDYVLLRKELRQNWNIFTDLINDDQVNQIIISICKDKYKYDRKLFEQPVVFREKYDPEILEQQSLTHGKKWEDFVREIINENRFHTRTINLKELEKLLAFMRITIPAGQVFYRCRINQENKRYTPKKMGAPPQGIASSGRANAPGISCLYLAKDAKTAIAEVRAGAYDHVTVGRFRLQQDIPVIDFRTIKTLCPVGIEMDYVDYAINHDHLVMIDKEMAKGLKNGDHSVDYVPTQYITDFIKSIRKKNKDGQIEKQYWGIIYNSTLHEQGYNIAAFYEDVFKCTSTREYQVKTVRYLTNPRIV